MNVSSRILEEESKSCISGVSYTVNVDVGVEVEVEVHQRDLDRRLGRH